MLAPLAFAIAALLALCTALSFAQLAARFPEAGGALVYVREGIRWNWLSVFVGLMTAMAGVVSAATVSLGFIGYLQELFALPELPALIFVVGSVGAVAAWGVRESVIAASVVTIVEVGGLLAILVFGTGYLFESPIPLRELSSVSFDGSNWTAIFGAAVLGFYAFLGFEDMVNVAEEVRDVRRALPRAILWTLGLSTALYISVTAVAVLIVSPVELAASEAPLALVFERSGGSGEILAVIAMAAMLNGALVQIVMASRILFSLGRQGQLPSWFARVHPQRRTPIVSTVLVSMAVGLFAAAFPLDSLAAATASIALAVFSLVNLSLLLLLLRESESSRRAGPVTSPWIPALGGVLSLGFLMLEIVGKIRA